MENRQRQQQRVESTQSLYFGLESRPADGIRAEAQFNVLGNVATNPINELFYEDRVFDVEFFDPAANDFQLIPGNERIAIYNAKVEWDDPWFNLEAFYRTGHYHWGYEGDFFGLRPETYYGQNIDIYQANVPIGVEIEGKKALRGFKLLFGQQVYWGANPLIMGKYETKVGAYDLALIHQEDLAQQQDAAVSAVIPQPKSRKTTLYVARQLNNVKVEVGGILAGSPLIGEDIQRVEDAPDGTTSYLNSGFLVFDDEIRFVDTLGAKGKLTGTFGSVNAYVQGAYKGLVASGGPDATLTYTGWTLKESGQGNQWNVLGGFTARYGNLQIAPNFIYQKPLAEALPNIPGFADPVTGEFFPG
ncbi:MAG: glycosidase, partial [Myxococcota bacterium]